MEQREKGLDRGWTQSCNVKERKVSSRHTSHFHLQGMSLFLQALVRYLLKMHELTKEKLTVLGRSSLLRLEVPAAALALGISRMSFPREAKAESFSSTSLPSGINDFRTAHTY